MRADRKRGNGRSRTRLSQGFRNKYPLGENIGRRSAIIFTYRDINVSMCQYALCYNYLRH